MSQSLVANKQHVRIPPSLTKKSSNPGGRGFGISTSPEISLARQVPQFPEVQLVGIITPARSATSARGVSGSAFAEPIICFPRKNLTTGRFPDIRNSPVLPSSPSTCLLVEN